MMLQINFFRKTLFIILLVQLGSCKSRQVNSAVSIDYGDVQKFDLVVELINLNNKDMATFTSGLVTGRNTVLTIKIPEVDAENIRYKGLKPIKSLDWDIPDEDIGFRVLIFEDKTFVATQFSDVDLNGNSLVHFKVRNSDTVEKTGIDPVLQSSGFYLIPSKIAEDKFEKNSRRFTGVNRHIYMPGATTDIRQGDNSSAIIGLGGKLVGLLSRVYQDENIYGEIYLPWDSYQHLESFQKFIKNAETLGAEFSSM